MVMSLALTPRSTALVLIDLQKGILGNTLTPYDGAQVVRNGVRIGRALRQAGGTVVLVHVAFAADNADRLRQPVDAATPVPPGGMPAEWSEFVPDAEALHADVIITKRQWSAFHGTELDLQLRRRGVDTILLGGVATNFGVESTARDAWQHSYSVVLAEDATTSNGPDMHKFAVERILPRVARIRSTDEIVAALEAASK
jgi:nicotinamidase-related amidase